MPHHSNFWSGKRRLYDQTFPGGGPQQDGLDPHFEFQKGQVYPGDNFEYHLIPCEAALEAGTAAIMPDYGVPTGQTDEDVVMSFNHGIVTGLLRERYGYDGIVCTDWGLITDMMLPETVWPARAWSVDHLSEIERMKKALAAGVDQFGGENCPEHIVNLVRAGEIPESRLDQSVRRLLRLKFQLGLFDDPFVDESRVPGVMGAASSVNAGLISQKRAMTLLKNEDGILPLQGRPKLYIKNMDGDSTSKYGELVDSPEKADLAIIRINTPWIPVDTKNPFAQGFHHGDLDFKGIEKAEILDLLRKTPTIVVLYLDRPAVIPEIAESAVGLICEFGACDTAVLDVIFGETAPEGKLPFELPSSMEAVRNQRSDVPYDSVDPLFPFGFGLEF